MSEETTVKLLHRHYEWFHHANSALHQVRLCKPKEFPNFYLYWMRIGFDFLCPLAAELKNATLIKLTQELESFLGTLTPQIITGRKRCSWSRPKFIAPLKVAVATARGILKLSPRTWNRREKASLLESPQVHE